MEEMNFRDRLSQAVSRHTGSEVSEIQAEMLQHLSLHFEMF